MTLDDFVESDNPAIICLIDSSAHELPVAVLIMEDNQNRIIFFNDLLSRDGGCIPVISKSQRRFRSQYGLG